MVAKKINKEMKKKVGGGRGNKRNWIVIVLVRERKKESVCVIIRKNGTLTIVPRIYAVRDFEFDTSHLSFVRNFTKPH
jgi:hypothetical protein